MVATRSAPPPPPPPPPPVSPSPQPPLVRAAAAAAAARARTERGVDREVERRPQRRSIRRRPRCPRCRGSAQPCRFRPCSRRSRSFRPREARRRRGRCRRRPPRSRRPCRCCRRCSPPRRRRRRRTRRRRRRRRSTRRRRRRSCRPSSRRRARPVGARGALAAAAARASRRTARGRARDGGPVCPPCPQVHCAVTAAPDPPARSMVPATVTSPTARRSSTPLPLTRTVTPAGMLIVVKLCTPGVSTVLVVGLNAPSLESEGKRVQIPDWHVVPAPQIDPQPPPQRVRVSTSQPFEGLPSQSAKLRGTRRASTRPPSTRRRRWCTRTRGRRSRSCSCRCAGRDTSPSSW